MMSIDTARAPGANCHSTDDVQQHFGVTYTEEQLRQLQAVPFSEETLQEGKATHVLVAGYPLSLLDLRDRHPELFSLKKPAWYERQGFARERVTLRWHLLRKAPHPHSFDKTFAQQTALPSAEDEMPRVCEVAYALLLHHLATGQRLFAELYVRCADLASGGHRVIVGRFGRDGLGVYDGWDNYRGYAFGLAVARKSS